MAYEHPYERQPAPVEALPGIAVLRFRAMGAGRFHARLDDRLVLLAPEAASEGITGDPYLCRLEGRGAQAYAHPIKRLDPGEMAAGIRSNGGRRAEPGLLPLPPRRDGKPLRVALFVDSANVVRASKEVGYYIDWERTRDALTRGGSFVGGFYYLGQEPGGNPAMAPFLDFLGNAGFVVRTKPIKLRHDPDTGLERPKANLDVEIALDMVHLADRYDVAVLLSGDSDFERVVELLRSRGKKVHVVASRRSLSRELGYAADKPLLFLEDHEKAFGRNDRRPGDQEPEPAELETQVTWRSGVYEGAAYPR